MSTTTSTESKVSGDLAGRVGRRAAAALLVAMLVAAATGLRAERRRWWCGCGSLAVGSAGIRSPHTSQHLVDPYSLTHALHGLVFYALLRLLAGRLRWETRFLLAVGLECLWELAENSPWVIGRYRNTTIALGYEGDSVLNSLGDVASCAFGFLVASRLPARWSIALFLAVDLALLILYRDNLMLNVVMLVRPIDAIRSWQSGR